jgi:hypothetical protein
MKLLSTVTMCACAGMFAAHVSAQAGQAPATAAPQAPPPAAAAPQTPPPTATAKADSVTIEGCVQRSPSASTAAPSATPGATGTAGTTAASSSMFVLANAMKPAASAAASPAAPGAPAAPAAAASSAAIASSYRLDADDSKLTPHVGHKVEITGTVDSSSASSSPGASAVPKLKVDSVKMVAASCAP